MQEYQLASSFRDPNGFIFHKEGTVYRQINPSYYNFYNHLIDSGLYEELIARQYLVTHHEIERSNEHIIIRPEQLPLITYPYEWCFSQLKAAAILTLKIQQLALRFRMSLKDATANNIQFCGNKPVFIDTLSFEPYRDGLPWKAYGQFCRHFLAPLLLMRYVDVRCIHMLQRFLDGIPVDLASRMLPWKTHWSLFVQLHIHVHARFVEQYAHRVAPNCSAPQMSFKRLQAMVESLLCYLDKLDYKQTTEWGNYYEATLNYTPRALIRKREVVRGYLERVRPVCLWDVGSNDGSFSRLAKDISQYIFSTDIDLQAVDHNYRQAVATQEDNIWPLFFDVTNPTPDFGLHAAQCSLEARLKTIGVDCILALALIHHLCITNNYPFAFIARLFCRMAPHLVIEFVQPSDSWASSLLARKEDARDLFSHYNQNEFENVFRQWYSIEDQTRIEGTHRVIYLMKRDANAVMGL